MQQVSVGPDTAQIFTSHSEKNVVHTIGMVRSHQVNIVHSINTEMLSSVANNYFLKIKDPQSAVPSGAVRQEKDEIYIMRETKLDKRPSEEKTEYEEGQVKEKVDKGSLEKRKSEGDEGQTREAKIQEEPLEKMSSEEEPSIIKKKTCNKIIYMS